MTNMTLNELRRIELLVVNAMRDRDTALQLAIDATKLLVVTKENLDDYKGHEFFKQCRRVFCGEQDSLDEIDENSFASMQQIAFGYLMKLKEQNLIDEKAVAAGVQNEQDDAFATTAKAILAQGNFLALGVSLASGMSKKEAQQKMDQIAASISNNAGNCNVNDPRAILKRLRDLHDQLGDQIGEIEDDPEDAASGLEIIYTEMETQLDALEEAFEIEGNENTTDSRKETGA